MLFLLADGFKRGNPAKPFKALGDCDGLWAPGNGAR